MGVSNVLQLLGGVALFLFGMGLMGDSLKLVAGPKLELVLYKLTNTALKGLLLGTVVTAVVQSSSAISATRPQARAASSTSIRSCAATTGRPRTSASAAIST